MIKFKTEGLEDLVDYFTKFPKEAPEAARRAVNFAARRYASEASTKISSNLNFRTKLYYPANPGKGRIAVRLADKADLTAIVSASSEPLLLSKFAVNFPRGAIRKGHKPKVKVGQAEKQMESSFYIQFKNKTVAIAIRLRKGESIRNRTSRRTYPLSKRDPSVQIMYGPSLDQAFETQIKDSMTPVTESVRREFIRQIGVLTRGR